MKNRKLISRLLSVVSVIIYVFHFVYVYNTPPLENAFNNLRYPFLLVVVVAYEYGAWVALLLLLAGLFVLWYMLFYLINFCLKKICK